MHFSGVFLRRETAANEWAHHLRHIAEGSRTPSTHVLRDLGRVKVVADSRLARLTESGYGLAVNTGSFIAPRGVLVADSAKTDADLHRYLASCRGNFAGANIPADCSSVTLFTDLLGTHPLYYADLDDVVVFSTSEGSMTKLLGNRLRTDAEGLLEICAFGFPLADRTAFRQIKCLESAETAVFDAAGCRIAPYFTWHDLGIPADSNLDDLASRTYASFESAIRSRHEPAATCYSMLSGGMDSRAIVATQVANGIRPATLSAGHPRALDAVLAERAARNLDCPFSFHGNEYSAFASLGGMPKIIHDIVLGTRPPPDSSAKIWSGDGGSVGLGGVHLTEEILRHARSGNMEATAAEYLRSNNTGSLSARLFRRDMDVQSFAYRAVMKELGRFTTLRRSQIPYLFLLLNDQRRHIHHLYELEMEVALEYLTPFWDSAFMKIVLECPDEEILYHRFYSRFFRLLPPAAREVPWQTYPGHVTCPLPLPDGYDYGWGQGPRPADVALDRKRARGVLSATTRIDFPSAILRRSMTAAAASAVLLPGGMQRSYLMNQVSVVLEHAAVLSTWGVRAGT